VERFTACYLPNDKEEFSMYSEYLGFRLLNPVTIGFNRWKKVKVGWIFLCLGRNCRFMEQEGVSDFLVESLIDFMTAEDIVRAIVNLMWSMTRHSSSIQHFIHLGFFFWDFSRKMKLFCFVIYGMVEIL